MSDNILKFPIGDWSKDGHNECDWFVISTTKTAEEVGEISQKIPDILGFPFGKLCQEYGQSNLTKNQIDALAEAGVDISVIIAENVDNTDKDIDGYWLAEGSEDLFEIWMALLQIIDPTFEYTWIKPTEMSYHLGYQGIPGYGLFGG